MPWSSRKHPCDKTELIAPLDVNPYTRKHLHALSL